MLVVPARDELETFTYPGTSTPCKSFDVPCRRASQRGSHSDAALQQAEDAPPHRRRRRLPRCHMEMVSARARRRVT
eukprot:7109820-Prymnesium_polylepis.1